MDKTYEYIIVGAGIAGCSTAYFLSKYTNSLLLIDRNCDLAQGASGAAGAFLSPLLGKPNRFKELVTDALNFSLKFYKDVTEEAIDNCGVIRIPKDEENEKKFQSYKPYMDFEFIEEENGYFFKVGSKVNPYNICKILTKNVKKRFRYEINSYKKDGDFWILNDEIKCKKLILCTGADISLIKEKYFNIRAVWGQKIDIKSKFYTSRNYHKSCSISSSIPTSNKNEYLTSIGATHNRIDCNLNICNCCLGKDQLLKLGFDTYSNDLVESNNKELIEKANEIVHIEKPEIVDIKIGPRASSVDYFPMVGSLVDSNETIKRFPHLKNGSHIKNEMLITTNNLYVLNGVGGRGYVLSPYLAYNLIEYINDNKLLDESVLPHRLFKRWIKKNN